MPVIRSTLPAAAHAPVPSGWRQRHSADGRLTASLDAAQAQGGGRSPRLPAVDSLHPDGSWVPQLLAAGGRRGHFVILYDNVRTKADAAAGLWQRVEGTRDDGATLMEFDGMGRGW